MRWNVMFKSLQRRILIIGNAGAGKSVLAQRLAARAGCAHTQLDDVYWIDQWQLHKRSAADAKAMVLARSLEQEWVIEGVFGWLAEIAMPPATALIWLDLPWIECQAGLLTRGPLVGQSAAEFADLVAWSQQYWTRAGSSSHAAHHMLFDAFAGEKVALNRRADVAAFMRRELEQSAGSVG
jgi:adenylate kinase family enzyme